ncbi:histidine protein methyltransferase 1 homolog isoform X2 [Leptinotarsa decemlineata]|uniref:histidine protein methyltransferase 1 homolog isoform X2 n=1 Tax=Leptinotarsa decemlineata TaxID=7539 RepID=UPI003D30B3E7
MFKFNFSSEDTDPDDEEKANREKLWKKCKEILYEAGNKCVEDIFQHVHTDSIFSNGSEIKYFRRTEILKMLNNAENLNENSVLEAERNHSDLVPAVYEGGLKIWECTYDLFSYINECDNDFTNKKVLDLGCGAGIIGITLYLKGANCWFQDYNSDVIQFLTIPNVLLNSRDRIQNCKFYSGDWDFFVDTVDEPSGDEQNKFDYIFTSETIYNTESYPKLHKVFEKLLKKTGVICKIILFWSWRWLVFISRFYRQA